MPNIAILTRRITLLALLALVPLHVSAAAAPPTVDNSIYAGLLAKYVHNGVVDYKGFQSEEKQLDQYLAYLGTIVPSTLSRDGQMAFYINLYNASTIKLILTAYPGIKSIKDLGGFFTSPWEKEFVVLDGRKVSLDFIEHSILRPQFQDPRIHFAVNCASKSCPPLLSEPYVGSRLNAQLDQVTTAFINNPKDTYIRGNTLYVSPIFKWYREDFKNGVRAFVEKYARDGLKKEIAARGSNLDISYLDYDWSLNGH